jgi:hypothetical protein
MKALSSIFSKWVGSIIFAYLTLISLSVFCVALLAVYKDPTDPTIEQERSAR